MEYIDGANLYEFIRQRDITIKQALVIVLHICKGLKKAHKSGIIHRDIKPANIMIDKDGWVKLLDFGLAKLVANKTIPRIGSRMGTAPYFSPEQLRGEEPKPATDIFSLGIILYELIARQRPFDGDTEQNIMYNILHKKPERLARYNAEVTPRLQKVIDKALNKNARRRYQSIAHFMHDLERERRYYAKLRSAPPDTANKNSMARNVSLYLRDIESSIHRFSMSNFLNGLDPLKRFMRNIVVVVKKNSALPLAILVLLATLSGAFLVLNGAHEKFNTASVLKTSPIKALVQIKDTPTLFKTIDAHRRRGLIATSEKVNFERSEDCYLFVFDRQKVVDIFAMKGNLLYSLYSKKTYPKSTQKLAGKYKIWVQDLSVSKRKTPGRRVK
jgi:serine/threonine protein kinase